MFRKKSEIKGTAAVNQKKKGYRCIHGCEGQSGQYRRREGGESPATDSKAQQTMGQSHLLCNHHILGQPPILFELYENMQVQWV